MHKAGMRLQINGVVYEKDSEISNELLSGVNTDYLKKMGALVECEKEKTSVVSSKAERTETEPKNAGEKGKKAGTGSKNAGEKGNDAD